MPGFKDVPMPAAKYPMYKKDDTGQVWVKTSAESDWVRQDKDEGFVPATESTPTTGMN